MKKSLQIYIAVILFISLASCKGQNRTDQLNKNINHKEVVLFESIHVIQEVDTIWTPNAPARMTRKIRKDNEGNLLFASYKDVIRYDGTSFTKFTKEEGLDSYDAFDVWEDRKGNIWIASTHFGIFQYSDLDELKNGDKSFNHFTTKNGLINIRSMCIYEDKAGGIWIGTEGGISYYDGKTLINEKLSFRNFTKKDGLTNNSINTIMEDKSGKIWVGTRGMVSIYDPLATLEPDKVTFTDFTDNEGKTFYNIWSILEDKKGNIWLGGQNGLWRYDGNIFINLTTVSVISIYEDKKGNVWFTHGADATHTTGFSYYDQKSLLESNPKATQVFSGGGMLWGMAEDKDGAIWVGKLNGVLRYDGKSVSYFSDQQSKGK
jgi:ligand-binding sensor domain-containing protein